MESVDRRTAQRRADRARDFCEQQYREFQIAVGESRKYWLLADALEQAPTAVNARLPIRTKLIGSVTYYELSIYTARYFVLFHGFVQEWTTQDIKVYRQNADIQASISHRGACRYRIDRYAWMKLYNQTDEARVEEE